MAASPGLPAASSSGWPHPPRAQAVVAEAAAACAAGPASNWSRKRRITAQLDVVVCPRVDRPRIDPRQHRLANQVRNQNKHHLVLLHFLVLRAETDTSELGSAQSPGVPLLLVLSCFVRIPARIEGSPSRSWIVCSIDRCPMIGSVTPEITRVARVRRVLHLHLQRDPSVQMHRRRHVDIYADVDILKLRLHADACRDPCRRTRRV